MEKPCLMLRTNGLAIANESSVDIVFGRGKSIHEHPNSSDVSICKVNPLELTRAGFQINFMKIFLF